MCFIRNLKEEELKKNNFNSSFKNPFAIFNLIKSSRKTKGYFKSMLTMSHICLTIYKNHNRFIKGSQLKMILLENMLDEYN